MHTVISSFSDRNSAERARERLLAAGFHEGDLHIQHRDSAAAGGDDWPGLEREVAVGHDILASYGRFFTSLFGKDHAGHHTDTYARAVERGECVLVLDTHSHEDAARAHQVVNEMGVVQSDMVERTTRPPLRDLVAERQARRADPADGLAGSAVRREQSERAFAYEGKDLDKVGLRYADKDKPDR